jgi:glyoxylase-like metal-dependent hydrolase (beta-lactamase superfamily II)
MKLMPHRLSFKLLTGFLAAICLPGVVAVPANAQSGAPTPAIGLYRTMVGKIEVTALSDGTNQRTVEQQMQLMQGDKQKIRDLLVRAYPDEQLETAVNTFLINTGAKLVLVDAGNGSMGSATMGNVMKNLRAAGYQPEKIDEVYLTHMHVDHIGGLVSGSERSFPNATVFADQSEADYWLNDSNLNVAPDSVKRTFQAVKTALAPYISAGKFKTFAGSTELTPGIRSQPAFGHTFGHTMYFVESEGKTLVLWGDIIHVAAVQFADPTVTMSFDSNQAEALNARQRILLDAAKNRWLIGGVHLLFPGIGQVRARDDSGYVFLSIADAATK